MGNAMPRAKKLSPKTIEELTDNIDVTFSRKEIEEWHEEYKAQLSTKRKELTTEEFKNVYNSVFQGDASEFAEHVFRTFDTDGNGSVDFQEFIVGLCVSGAEDIDTKLDWAFKVYDIDGDGKITRVEMTKVISAIFRMTQDTVKEVKGITPEDLVNRFFKFDVNHDGVITKEEFVQGVKDTPMIVDILTCHPEPDTE